MYVCYLFGIFPLISCVLGAQYCAHFLRLTYRLRIPKISLRLREQVHHLGALGRPVRHALRHRVRLHPGDARPPVPAVRLERQRRPLGDAAAVFWFEAGRRLARYAVHPDRVGLYSPASVILIPPLHILRAIIITSGLSGRVAIRDIPEHHAVISQDTPALAGHLAHVANVALAAIVPGGPAQAVVKRLGA